ncbi:hypothetical protein BB558_000928 [Smittium angustum]|uniref:G-protein coupled receptors family 2 profile 2 domain-containing protein n=1 Tax=Smittium angustum TaxID=133377 RepID=A0A2U1JCV3_SMIAN|nr:hypothetical protein BB558_000928 [Smittium angustum]
MKKFKLFEIDSWNTTYTVVFISANVLTLISCIGVILVFIFVIKKHNPKETKRLLYQQISQLCFYSIFKSIVQLLSIKSGLPGFIGTALSFLTIFIVLNLCWTSFFILVNLCLVYMEHINRVSRLKNYYIVIGNAFSSLPALSAGITGCLGWNNRLKVYLFTEKSSTIVDTEVAFWIFYLMPMLFTTALSTLVMIQTLVSLRRNIDKEKLSKNLLEGYNTTKNQTAKGIGISLWKKIGFQLRFKLHQPVVIRKVFGRILLFPLVHIFSHTFYLMTFILIEEDVPSTKSRILFALGQVFLSLSGFLYSLIFFTDSLTTTVIGKIRYKTVEKYYFKVINIEQEQQDEKSSSEDSDSNYKSDSDFNLFLYPEDDYSKGNSKKQNSKSPTQQKSPSFSSYETSQTASTSKRHKQSFNRSTLDTHNQKQKKYKRTSSVKSTESESPKFRNFMFYLCKYILKSKQDELVYKRLNFLNM